MATLSNTTCTVSTAGLNAQIALLLPNTKKKLPDVVNQRGANALGRAFNETKRATRSSIQTALGQVITVSRITKNGKIRKTTKLGKLAMVMAYRKGAATGAGEEAPLAAILVQVARRNKGLKGLYGKDMKRAILKKIQARFRAIGFGASGWIPSIKTLLSKVRGAFVIARLSEARIYGAKKGSGVAATASSWKPQAIAINTAKEITKVDAGALQRGVDAETKEIASHIQEKLAEDFKAFNQASRK